MKFLKKYLLKFFYSNYLLYLCNMKEKYNSPSIEDVIKLEEIMAYRIELIKTYMTEEGLEVNTYDAHGGTIKGQELIEIDLAKVNAKQFRHVKRILSGKYDKFDK